MAELVRQYEEQEILSKETKFSSVQIFTQNNALT